VETTSVSITAGAETLVLGVHGVVDRDGGSLVLETLEAALGALSPRTAIEVDLRRVDRYSSDGRRALAACARLCDRAGAHVRFRIGDDPVGDRGDRGR
jgi:anti-anti-sigma regulatory factor